MKPVEFSGMKGGISLKNLMGLKQMVRTKTSLNYIYRYN